MAHITQIQLYRGAEASLPTLAAGEPAFTTDSKKLFVGDGTTNHQIGAVAAGSVTNTQLANMPAYTIKANATGSAAAPQDIAEGDLPPDVPASGDKILGWLSTGELAEFDFADFGGGGAAWTFADETGTFTAGTTNYTFYRWDRSSSFTSHAVMTLPPVSGNSGLVIGVEISGVTSDSRDGKVKGNSSELIDGVNEILLSASLMKLILLCDGTKWIIIWDNRHILAESVGGWIAAAGTWTYASADSPTFTLTVGSDVTSIIGVGNKIKLTQTTVKYFIVTAISYSSPNTTITLYGGTDYTLANAAITSPYYSYVKSPVGFPMSPAKWQVKVTDSNDKQKTSPTTNTWYGGANAFSTGANITISVPIGVWRLGWSAYQYVLDTSATITTMEATLSSSDSSESDEELTASIGGNGASSTMTVRQTTRAETIVTLAAKTTYYLLLRTETTGMSDLNLAGTNRASIITAECVYL